MSWSRSCLGLKTKSLGLGLQRLIYIPVYSGNLRESLYKSRHTVFLQRVRIARNADRCTS